MQIRFLIFSVVLLVSIPGLWVSAKEQPPLRARPPSWSSDVNEVFFLDARKHLIGDRPRHSAAESSEASTRSEAADMQSDMKWSAIIEPDALTTEVKRIHNRLTPLLARAGRFKSGGSADSRREFSLLAVLFDVVDEYDQEVRWKQEAARMRGLCSQAAQACETASDESLALAADVHAQIAELLSGQSTTRQASGDEAPIDRGQLMLRMELAVEENISPWLANRKEFRRRKSEVAQESQLLAMLARIVCREQYEYADDEGFVEIARDLGRAAQQLTKASEQNDYEAARQAAGRVTQSCSNCHDDYRG
jgi:hypothetical protein